MYTIIIALVAGAAIGAGSATAIGPAWGTFVGVVVALGVTTLLVRKYVGQLKKVTEGAQARIMEGQEEAQRLIGRYQNRPVGTPKMMQDKVEKIIADKVREALVLTEEAAPLYPWIPLGEKQVATLRFTLNYQIKQFEAADADLPNILTLEPTVLAMKICRQFKTEPSKVDKTFRKGVGRFKYEKGKLIWAAYIWGLVKADRLDDAVSTLAEAKDKIEDDVFAKNWQTAVNGNANRISFASLGNEWFSLHLEAPKQQKPGKGAVRNHPLSAKGSRRR